MKPLMMLVILTLLAGCATHQSPTGRGQTLLFSAQEMDQMGAASFEEMKKQQPLSKNRQVNQYVACVAERITAVLPGQQPNWEVVVFESEQVNAFALPGGHIGVYTGLLKVANNQDQLATVIGHEVAHVLANHSNEQVSRAQMTGVGMQLANVALDAGGVSNKDLYMSALGLGAQVGFILPYGREQESEADIMGVELMARAGFDPSQSILLWQNMAKAGGSQGPELLSTHPSHDHRIADLQQMQAKVLPLYQNTQSSVKNSCE
ncbi:M48 family metallopeptidase [Shewanella colwelliana]|uniref:Zn-dependent protease n=1 Tax=Shewanella colwelliana TaxID=23 RepID=A0A1E5ISE7_SHECO|nr:M48 family metallopeptidase [Shewanella colwelliana]MDX1281899.1 M48 family metallopeptidase [Shewanella colwelliana]OEG73482.1 Zn-dependent protease [Shewanella colwelliana]GIU40205.1 Zn-dependent protease [Shewanella colwelliana]